MRYFSLENLRRGISDAEALADVKQLFTDVGFKTANWDDGSFQLNFLQIIAKLVYKPLVDGARDISNSLFVTSVTGSRLQEKALSDYNIPWIEPLATQGNMVVSMSLGSGPYTVLAREMGVTDGVRLWYNMSSFSLTDDQLVVTSSFEAEETGTAYNIASDTTLRPKQSFAGVTVSNPVPPDAETWITRYGTDGESDFHLQERCRRKVDLASLEATRSRVQALAISGSSDIAYTYVDSQNPRGAGTVDVYVAGDDHIPGSSDVQAAAWMITGSFFDGGNGRISVQAASAVTLDLSGTVYYDPTYTQTKVQENVELALQNYVKLVPVGGLDLQPLADNAVSRSDIVQQMENADGVRTVVLTSPDPATPYIQLGVSQKLVTPAAGYTALTYTRMYK